MSCLGLDVGAAVTPSTTPTVLDAPAPGVPFCRASVGRLLCRRMFQPGFERPSGAIESVAQLTARRGRLALLQRHRVDDSVN